MPYLTVALTNCESDVMLHVEACQKQVPCEKDFTEWQLTAFEASLEACTGHMLSDMNAHAAECHAIHSKSQACNANDTSRA